MELVIHFLNSSFKASFGLISLSVSGYFLKFHDGFRHDLQAARVNYQTLENL
jgi:hypothetical protein